MTHISHGVAAWLIVSAVSGCDNRQVFHEPEPGLERMLLQPRGAPYGASSAFPDGRSMRMPVADTVPRERLRAGQVAIETGRDDAGYLHALPLPVTRASLQQGHVEFERVCATCHGVLGDGHSVVAEKMTLRKPPSLHDANIVRMPVGKTFEVVSIGYGLMPGYAAQLEIEQRWAVVSYLDALRLSRAVPVAKLSEAMRAELRRAAP